jgi:hypothetical protein
MEVVVSDATYTLFRLIDSPNPEVGKYAVWVLANIAGEFLMLF